MVLKLLCFVNAWYLIWQRYSAVCLFNTAQNRIPARGALWRTESAEPREAFIVRAMTLPETNLIEKGGLAVNACFQDEASIRSGAIPWPYPKSSDFCIDRSTLSPCLQ